MMQYAYILNSHYLCVNTLDIVTKVMKYMSLGKKLGWELRCYTWKLVKPLRHKFFHLNGCCPILLDGTRLVWLKFGFFGLNNIKPEFGLFSSKAAHDLQSVKSNFSQRSMGRSSCWISHYCCHCITSRDETCVSMIRSHLTFHFNSCFVYLSIFVFWTVKD